MARLATEGASERDAMLKKGIEGISSDKKAGNVAKWQKNSDDNEREMRQQMSTSETKAKKRANAEEKKPRVANSAGKSPTSSHQSDIEHEQNLRENKKYSIKKSITVFLKFIYHDGYVCNRTICSWFITILYLLFIYIFLALIVAAGIYVMLHTTQDAPVYYGETTFIGGVPGIGFEPRKRSMKKEQNIFKWNIDDPTSYAFYVGRLRRILYEYTKKEMMPNKFKIDCNQKVLRYMSGKHFCKIDATNTDEDHGYGACALTKKLFGYYPERPKYDLFANSSLDFETSKICGQTSNTTACCNDDRMLFACLSMEKYTNVTIVQYPKFGYPYCFYPFNKQDDYMQPFIMIQLFNLIPNKRTGIKCVPTAPDLQGRSLKLWFEITSKKKELT